MLPRLICEGLAVKRRTPSPACVVGDCCPSRLERRHTKPEQNKAICKPLCACPAEVHLMLAARGCFLFASPSASKVPSSASTMCSARESPRGMPIL